MRNFTSLTEKEMRFWQPKVALRGAELGNVVKGSKAAAVRQTSAGKTPSTWQRGSRHTSAQGLGFMPAVGSAGGHGDRRALPCRLGSAPRRAGRCFCPWACRMDRQFFNASLQFTNMDRVMEEGQQVHIPARHLGVVCYALGNYFPGCARSPALLEGPRPPRLPALFLR